jgi:hypothetical protein
MEPVGFAVGVIGLAGLFTNVIDCLNYIHIGKNFGDDFETNLIKLDNAMLKLSRWGEAVGLSGSLSDATYLPSWIKAEEAETAKRTLGQILNLFDKAAKQAEKFKKEHEGTHEEYNEEKDLDGSVKTFHKVMRDKCLGRQNQTKKSDKFRFAVYDRDHLKTLIEQITSLTDDLVNLFPERPAVAKKEKELCEDEVKALTISLKDLAEMIKENDKALASALAEVLKPAVSHVGVLYLMLQLTSC